MGFEKALRALATPCQEGPPNVLVCLVLLDMGRPGPCVNIPGWLGNQEEGCGFGSLFPALTVCPSPVLPFPSPEVMVGMGYTREEIKEALSNQKYNEVTATYLLLGRKTEVSGAASGDAKRAGKGF